MIRQRREERREEREVFGRRGTAVRYQMRQRMLAIGDDFWIEDEGGQRVFKVDGRALRIRKLLLFQDAQGNDLCRIQERMLRVRDTLVIEDAQGNQAASVRKAIITPIRDRWTVKVGDGPDLEIQGNILHHEYMIGDGDRRVGEVSKRWFRIRDTYGVAVEPSQNDVLILATTVAVAIMAHGGR
ncbi:MAG: hypothetical protein HC911_14540 [Chloroflexaceae bacterium]|nr:hypothetical protein [Chloroflexaceae bacterium]